MRALASEVCSFPSPSANFAKWHCFRAMTPRNCPLSSHKYISKALCHLCCQCSDWPGFRPALRSSYALLLFCLFSCWCSPLSSLSFRHTPCTLMGLGPSPGFISHLLVKGGCSLPENAVDIGCRYNHLLLFSPCDFSEGGDRISRPTWLSLSYLLECSVLSYFKVFNWNFQK